MRFLVDNQLPAALVRWIEARSCDACHVLDVGLANAVDPEILRYAEASGRILITKDEDFHHLILRHAIPG